MTYKVTSPKLKFELFVDFERKPAQVDVQFNPEKVRMRCTKKDGTPLTKAEFAALIGLTSNGYSGLSNQPTQQRNGTIARIISATGCRLEDLFEEIPVI